MKDSQACPETHCSLSGTEEGTQSLCGSRTEPVLWGSWGFIGWKRGILGAGRVHLQVISSAVCKRWVPGSLNLIRSSYEWYQSSQLSCLEFLSPSEVLR